MSRVCACVYHVYKDVWSSYIREVPYCHHDERSVVEPFKSSTAAKQNRNICSLEVLVKRQVNQVTRYGIVTRAATTELKQRPKGQ